MSRDYRLYLDDIIASIEKIKHYTQDVSFDDFVADEMRFDAVLRNLEIIGEAVKNIPPEIRQKYSAMEWRRIAGMRDMMAHAYFVIDLEIVWDVIQHKLPELQDYVAMILAQEEQSPSVP